MDWLIKHGEKALRPEKRSSNLLLLHKRSTVYYDPLGVVAAIVSWNYRKRVFHTSIPFYIDMEFLALHNAWTPILAALFAGNAIVLKCSEHVLWSTAWFIDVIQTCLLACGYDRNIVQVDNVFTRT